jgi:two-component system KDP operon response regulator KdpE
MSDASILVADDEPQIRRVLRSTLSSQGYVIIEAKTGEEAVEAVRKEKPDLVLLDVNMPGIGGIAACREIRQSSDAPIIMLTVRNAERDKVLALDAGADDYVVKPFGIEELLARIRAALRRYAPGDTLPPFVSKDLTLDFESRQLTVRGQEVHLTPKDSCSPFGGRTMGKKRKTCGWSSTNCAKRSRATRRSRTTSARNRGWDIASNRRA